LRTRGSRCKLRCGFLAAEAAVREMWFAIHALRLV
jgi:hypothetical protein